MEVDPPANAESGESSNSTQKTKTVAGTNSTK